MARNQRMRYGVRSNSNRSAAMSLIARQKVPALKVPTLAHGVFDVHAAKPERMTLICFYRGLHCPICAS
jgi:hypothetical protein